MIAVIACAGLVGLAFGYSLPLLSVVMENAGISSILIGLSASSESAAILLFGPSVPRMIGALGLRNAMFAATLVGVVALGALAFFDPLYAWFPLRFVLGGAIFLVLIASDIWIIGSDGQLPIFVGAASLASAVLPLFFAYGPAPAMEQAGKLRPLTLLLAMPLLVAAVFAFGFIDSSGLSLLPVYGLHLSMDEEASFFLVTVLVAGSILLQFPIGWLADRIDRFRVLQICALAGAAAAVLLPLSLGTDWAMWSCLFIIGGTMVGLYTISLAILGDRYSGSELAAAVTLIAMILAGGSTLGPLIGGGAIELWNPYGLNAAFIGAFCLVVALALFLGLRRRSGT